MSNFTYEIDERNLRIQLKEFVVPVKEDAWQKFETFADSMVSHQRENRLKSFNFSMNRNVVLPSVFGVIIILFSFLLVNFVSIKNPVKENDQKAEAVTKTVAPVEENKPKTEKAVPAVVTESKPEVAAVATPTVAETKAEEPAATVAAPKPEPAPAQALVSTETTTAETVATNALSEETKAKRRARRRAEAVESQKLSEIRPTPVSEERDSEIRPD